MENLKLSPVYYETRQNGKFFLQRGGVENQMKDFLLDRQLKTNFHFVRSYTFLLYNLLFYCELWCENCKLKSRQVLLIF